MDHEVRSFHKENTHVGKHCVPQISMLMSELQTLKSVLCKCECVRVWGVD